MFHVLPRVHRAVLVGALTFTTPAFAGHEITFEFETVRGYCCGTHQTVAAAGQSGSVGPVVERKPS